MHVKDWWRHFYIYGLEKWVQINLQNVINNVSFVDFHILMIFFRPDFDIPMFSPIHLIVRYFSKVWCSDVWFLEFDIPMFFFSIFCIPTQLLGVIASNILVFVFQRFLVFATNSNFVIPKSLQPDFVNLWHF